MKILLLFIFPVILFACRQETSYRKMSGMIYGTTYHITYQSAQNLDEQVVAKMQSVNNSLSLFDTNSVLSGINRGETEQTDSLFRKVWGMAEKVYRETGGAFDITVAPLVNEWGFGYKNAKLPSSEKVDSLMHYIGMNKIRLENGLIKKEHPETEIDGGAIAKGLGVDVAAELLEESGVVNYMVEIGGEVRLKGVSEKKRSWRIGIDKPEENPLVSREWLFILGMEEGAIATSGNYRNFYVHEGKKYAHTIDPRTGYPVQTDIISASVVTSSCMEADAFATSFMVLGLEESKKVLAKNPHLEACLIYQEEEEIKIWTTEGFKRLILD